MTAKRLFNVPEDVRALDTLASLQGMADRVGRYYPLEAEHFANVLALGREAVVALHQAGISDAGVLVDALDGLERDDGGPECWRPKIDRIAAIASEFRRRLPGGERERGVPMYAVSELLASMMDQVPQEQARGLKHLFEQTTRAAEYDWLPRTSPKRRRK